jgi:hypothetical protein
MHYVPCSQKGIKMGVMKMPSLKDTDRLIVAGRKTFSSKRMSEIDGYECVIY